MATGSYEGSLTMEGASDHLLAVGLHGPAVMMVSAGPSLFRPLRIVRNHKGMRGEFESTHEGDVSAKRKTGSRQRCQRSHPIERHGSNRPVLVTRSRKDEGTRTTFEGVRGRSGSSVVKTLVSSIMQRSSHGLLRGVPDRESGPRESRTTADGCTFFVTVAEVGWTHRASSAPGVRKGSWSERALARRKPEALPDAEHGWRDGETVRDQALVLNCSRA
jgi:hypothetical protein